MSLIAVSPRKVGVVFTGWDQQKFIQRPKATTRPMSHTQFIEDRFVVYSNEVMCHIFDPTAGIDGSPQYPVSILDVLVDGMAWDGSTMMVNSRSSGSGSARPYLSGDLGASFYTSASYPTSCRWSKIAYGVVAGVPTWLTVGRLTNGGTGGAFLARSTNIGASWENRSTATGYAGCDEIAFNPNGEKFLAGATSSNTLKLSTNGGLSWTNVFPFAGYGSTMRRIFCIDNKFVVLSNSTYIAFSDDGVNWSVYSFPVGVTTNNWNSVCNANGVWVVANTTGVFMYSFDMVNWSAATVPTSQYAFTITQVAYGNGHIIFAPAAASIPFYYSYEI